MAKKIRKAFEFKGFCNHTLSKSMKSDYLSWLEKTDQRWVSEALASVIMSGYQLKLSFSDERASYHCHLIAVEPLDEPDNAGYILSSFGPDPSALVTLTLYKHFILLNRSWIKSNPKDDEEWG